MLALHGGRNERLAAGNDLHLILDTRPRCGIHVEILAAWQRDDDTGRFVDDSYWCHYCGMVVIQ